MGICPYMSRMIYPSLSDGSIGTTKNSFYTDIDDSKVISIYKIKDGPPDIELPGDTITDHSIKVGYFSCLESNCQLWDPVNNRCGTQVSDTLVNRNSNESTNILTMLEGVVGKIAELDNSNTLIKYLIDIVGKNEELLTDDQSILKIIKHNHDSHHHSRKHEAPKMPVLKGGPIGSAGGSTIPTTLLQEIMSNEDCDFNDKVFLKDFAINPNDPELPMMIKSIYTNYTTEYINSLEMMGWQEFKDSIEE